MAASLKPGGSIRFGPYELLVEIEELRKGGIRLRLTGQAIQVLILLASNPHRVVTREELQQKLWSGAAFGDFEHGLNAAVNRLREILGDSATDPKFIETIPRRGYRFIAQIEQPAEFEEIPPPRKPSRGKRSVALVTMLCVIAAGAFIAWKLQQRTLAELHPVPLNAFPGVAFLGSFSPDGQQVVFNWADKGPLAVFVQSVGAEQAHRVSQAAGDCYTPSWSPDGKSIAFAKPSPTSASVWDLVMIPAQGGHETPLTQIHWLQFPNVPAWSPDSKSVAFTDTKSSEQSAIYMLQLSDRSRTELTQPPQGTPGDSEATFSSDGNALAFIRTISYGVNQIGVLTLSSRDVHIVTTEFGHISGLAWSENGREIIYSSDKTGIYRLWRIPASGGASRLIEVGEDAHFPIVSAHSHRLAYARQHFDDNIWRIQIGEHDVQARTNLISSTRSENQPEFSPDGTKITFISDRLGSPEVWISNADGTDPVRLTQMKTGTPKWSPDGLQIAFDSREQGHSDIYVVSTNGSAPRRLTNEKFDDGDPSWSADGKWIYYTSTATGSKQVWKLRVDGGPAIQVTRQGGTCAFESADGSMLYYLSPKDEGVILQKRLPNGDEERIAEIPPIQAWNDWQVASGGIYFAAVAKSGIELRYFDLATRQTTKVVALPDTRNVGGGFSVSPDGRTILYTQTDSGGSEIIVVDDFH